MFCFDTSCNCLVVGAHAVYLQRGQIIWCVTFLCPSSNLPKSLLWETSYDYSTYYSQTTCFQSTVNYDSSEPGSQMQSQLLINTTDRILLLFYPCTVRARPRVQHKQEHAWVENPKNYTVHNSVSLHIDLTNSCRKMMINQDTACMFACCFANKEGQPLAHLAKPAIFLICKS